MGPGMFDGMFTALILFGVGLGLAGAGLIWFVVYLCRHISIAWVP